MCLTKTHAASDRLLKGIPPRLQIISVVPAREEGAMPTVDTLAQLNSMHPNPELALERLEYHARRRFRVAFRSPKRQCPGTTAAVRFAPHCRESFRMQGELAAGVEFFELPTRLCMTATYVRAAAAIIKQERSSNLDCTGDGALGHIAKGSCRF